MNPLLLSITAALVVAQFALPRRLAFLPLLIATCHTPYSATLGGQFSAVRLVLVAGLMRATFGGLLSWNPRKPLDLLMVIWSGLALLSAVGHHVGTPLFYRAGLVLNVFGTYLYTRAYVRNREDFVRFVRGLAVVLVPLAALLVSEAVTGANAYHAVGAMMAEAMVREDRTRAMGPFGTPILTGTVGAVCFPLFVALWRSHPKSAKVGIGASLVIIFTSASSGPIGTLLLGGGALFLWRWRNSLTKIKWACAGLLFVVQMFRNRSAWYLISMIDFVGGSTGWYRSRLLDSATQHLDEWWLWGTDVTRHWMPTGLRSNPDQCDLTSYYVHLGVIGGLPLLLALIAILWFGFRLLGRRMRLLRRVRSPDEFILWCVGSTLFAHTVTFLTVSYFDQVFVLFYSTVAMIPLLVELPAPVRAGAGVRPRPVQPALSPSERLWAGLPLQ